MTPPYDIILSGPISGTTDHKKRFAMAYVAARQAWHAKTGTLPNVWNPALLPDGRDNEWYMRKCHDAIFDSPACVLFQMAGWEDSKGSRSEHALCVCLGREIGKA